MSNFNIYNLQGEKVGTVAQPSVFSCPVDQKLIHRYYTWLQTILRNSIAHTKTRGDVAGGGKKPWKQKGTGRARVGSTRSPIWRHGGVTFGPRNTQTYAIRMPRGERRKALLSALSSKTEQTFVLQDGLADIKKTKQFIDLMTNLKIETGKSVLMLESKYDRDHFSLTNNLPKVETKTVSRLNLIDLLNADVLLLSQTTLTDLEKQFTPEVGV